MSTKDSIDIHIEMPVINEMVHCVTTQNYQMKLESRMIVDIFSKRYEGNLIETKN